MENPDSNKYVVANGKIILIASWDICKINSPRIYLKALLEMCSLTEYQKQFLLSLHYLLLETLLAFLLI